MEGTVLITGGCGFIGSNFVRHMLQTHPRLHVINLDKLTYAGNLANLRDVADDPRYRFVHGDIGDAALVDGLCEGVDAIVNVAAETHVDRSIMDATPFVEANVRGTQVLLEAARRHHVGRFVQVSTDEVYGDLGPTGAFVETMPLVPNNPYSATKAAADLLVLAFVHTHGLDAVITRCSNNYGPHQFPEKFIPLFVSNAISDQPLPLYGDGQNIRDWLYVVDHCRAIDWVLGKGQSGQVYNIGGRCEKTNIDVTREILRQLGKPESLIRFVKDRPGHDRRYAMDATKIETELGWRPQVTFEQGLDDTIRWYRDHADWVADIRTGAYLRYYEQQYGDRLDP